MKLPSILTIATAFLALTSIVSADTTTIYYPNQEEAVFTIEAPDDWHFEAGTEDNPYCTLSKDDTVLYFRTVEGTEEGIKEAIEETYEYVKETYPKAELPEPKETKIAGKEALAAAGGGKDKEGVATQFGFAWVFVSDDNIAELWFEVPETDEKLGEAVAKILKSFKAAKK
jgi:hypothetical protein